MSKNIKWKTYWVPISALLVILIHIIYVNAFNLSKWKGGGFGMYSEVHYINNDVYISNLKASLDSIKAIDPLIENAINDLRRISNTTNFKKLGDLISTYTSQDTLTIQVWKPLIDAKNETYSRELLNQMQYIKP